LLKLSILVPRDSRSGTSSLGPGTQGTGSARKLAVVSKAHTFHLGRFSTRIPLIWDALAPVTIFTLKYYEEMKLTYFPQFQSCFCLPFSLNAKTLKIVSQVNVWATLQRENLSLPSFLRALDIAIARYFAIAKLPSFYHEEMYVLWLCALTKNQVKSWGVYRVCGLRDVSLRTK
jgi:hypothetical protein